MRANNREVLARLFWDDPAFVSSAVPGGRFSLRLCIVNHNTTWDDVRETLSAAERFGQDAFSRPRHREGGAGVEVGGG